MPSPTIFIWLAIILGTTNIRIHGYIKRQIKQIGTEPKLILIPRIICTFEDKSKRTHNLLPDFVLPFCNYTVKSLASVFSAYIPTQTAIRFKLSDWDRLSTVAFSNRNKQTSSYIKQRGSKLFYRYGTISKMIVLFRKAKERKLYYPWKSFFKYYILTEIPNVSMCFLTLTPPISITHVSSGSAWNIITDSVFAEGTVRSFSAVARSIIIEKNDAVKDCLRD